MKEIDQILKLKNKLKRNEEYIDDKCKVSESIREEIRKIELKYKTDIEKELYVPVSVVNKIFGEEGLVKVKDKVVHATKIRNFDWMKGKVEIWMCSQENHLNMCADCTVCDRKLDKCIVVS